MDTKPPSCPRGVPYDLNAIEQASHELCGRLDEFGITRLGATTGLDCLDIPTYGCVKPNTTDVIWVYSGKGVTPAHARVTAIMECIERTSSLWDQRRVHRSTGVGPAEVWGPERFTEKLRRGDSRVRLWTLARRLGSSGGVVWVPAELVFGGRKLAPDDELAFAVTTSNGLGAGFSREEAIERALFEMIERHVVSCVELMSSHYAVCWLGQVAKALGCASEILTEFVDDNRFARTVAPGSLPDCASRMVDKFGRAGLDVEIKYLPNPSNVHVFGAVTVERMTATGVLAAAGYGASMDPLRALCGALLEVAQSRNTDRQGAREDCTDIEKARPLSVESDHWLLRRSDSAMDFRSIHKGEAWRLSDLLGALEKWGLRDVAVTEFTPFEGIHVARALVPGIETWHPTGGQSKLGTSMREYVGATLMAGRSIAT
jgi:ribosomal protein S12 methylthiotransferase accessory factor YcaO